MKHCLRILICCVTAFVLFTGCAKADTPAVTDADIVPPASVTVPAVPEAEAEETEEPASADALQAQEETAAPQEETPDADEPSAEQQAGALGAENPSQETAPERKTVTGSVFSVDGDTLVVRMDNGNLISFGISGVYSGLLREGDTVSVAYEGDITSRPDALQVELVKAKEISTATGSVLTKIDNDIFVQISETEVLRFRVTANTQIVGQKNVVREDNVRVEYEDTGETGPDAPPAIRIEILKANPDRRDLDPSLINKELTGTVTKLTSTKVTIVTSKSKNYSFRITGKTSVTEKKGDLEVGAKIRVTYDGYASDVPDAKEITVLASDDSSTVIYIVKGTISERTAKTLKVKATTGVTYTFRTENAKIKGNKNAGKGDTATVKFYYHPETGRPIATEITFK